MASDSRETTSGECPLGELKQLGASSAQIGRVVLGGQRGIHVYPVCDKEPGARGTCRLFLTPGVVDGIDMLAELLRDGTVDFTELSTVPVPPEEALDIGCI
ncbi:MAG TPA: hypothetical protein VLF40_05620 [Candidatus Saccharimonadales bacterium]|nr:hypothetical protein [Candidatus Saccharimonadales bacterium]